MAQERKIKRALIAVYDKTGIVEFARALVNEFGIEIISTGGTAKHLKDAGVPVTMVEEVTGFPEMLDGRVKTLHPNIHAAILADRDKPEHMRQLAEQGIKPIDMVVVNLYPFEKTVADPNCTFEQAIEMIDIGGPCLLRAAAKNHKHVLVVSDQGGYGEIMRWLRECGSPASDAELRSRWASNAYLATSVYDAQITEWLGRQLQWPWTEAIFAKNWGKLRYGENPHQTSHLWQIENDCEEGFDLTVADAMYCDTQPELSFNNNVDTDAALGLCAELTRAARGRAKILFAPVAQRSSLPDGQNQSPYNATGQRESLSYRDGASQPNSRFKPISEESTSRRKLPHWQIPGAAYFVTFTSAIGPFSEIERDIILSAVRFWEGKKIDLFAAAVMPDHVHVLLEPRPVFEASDDRFNLSEILQSIKAHSGREIAKLRNMSGQVWTRESYDRWMRDEEEFLEKWHYIADNPVKAGLADRPDTYRWWYGCEALGPFDVGSDVRPMDRSKEDLCPTGGAMGKEDLCPTVVFIKHTNACGVGIADDPIEAYRRAYLGDPNAAMGGVLAVNFEVNAEFATAVMETYDRIGKPLKEAGAAHAPGGFFIEVWVAPSFSDDAVEIIRGKKVGGPVKKWGENVRLLAVGDVGQEPDPNGLEYKTIAGGMLVQSRDLVGLNEDQWKVVTKRAPTESEIPDLRLAWLIAKHTKSNAISICKDSMLIGNGAGQMSRVMSCRIATWLAKENGHAEKLAGSVAASDAFFPFRDGPDILMDAGVTAIIQPGGSKRDEETIHACDERGVAMIFTGTRHFKH